MSARGPESGGEGRDCVWCGRRFDHGAERLGGRLRCGHCGAATTDPWPSAEQLDAAYGEWYRPRGGRRFLLGGDAILGRTRALLARRIDAIAPPGPVLDVGAGDGTLVDALALAGREATGLERSSERADLSAQPIAEIEGEWAAIVFWHSLEHLPDPGGAIGDAARLLMPGGVVVVAVPNNESLQARAFGDRWLHLDLPRHLVHLGSDSLRAGLEEAGLVVERSSQLRAGQIVIGWLDGLVGSLPGNLDLYQSLRHSGASAGSRSRLQRSLAIGSAILLLPVAVVAAMAEVALRRSGTIYVEARKPGD